MSNSRIDLGLESITPPTARGTTLNCAARNLFSPVVLNTKNASNWIGKFKEFNIIRAGMLRGWRKHPARCSPIQRTVLVRRKSDYTTKIE